MLWPYMSEAEHANLVQNADALRPMIIHALQRKYTKANSALIADCGEDAIMKFSEKLKTGWIPTNLRGWLYRAAEFYYRNEFRKLHGQRSLDDLAWEPETESVDVREFEEADEADKIFARMKNADYREAVWLIDYEDYSLEEAAEMMGKSVDAVYHLKERGEREARRICEEELGISPPQQ